MRRQLLITAPLLAALAACGTRPGLSSSAPGAPVAGSGGYPGMAPPVPGTASRPPLAAESARLGDLFRGTPVMFAMAPDGVLRVSVPRVHSFDTGSIRVKPALAAVLERLARSQASGGSKFRVSAPADAQGRGGSLPGERALSVRDYLVGHGIGVARVQVATGTVSTIDAVEIVVTETPAR